MCVWSRWRNRLLQTVDNAFFSTFLISHSVCFCGVRESKRQRQREVREQVGWDFFYEKKARCVKNRSSFCHAAVPPALLSLPPPLSAFVSLPTLPAALSAHLPLSFSLLLPPFTSLWFVFPPNSPVFLFPFLSMLFLSVCVRVCKPARCLSLSLSDVQQLLEGSFFLPYTRARAYTHTHMRAHLSFAQDLTYFLNSYFFQLWWSLIPYSLHTKSFISSVPNTILI